MAFGRLVLCPIFFFHASGNSHSGSLVRRHVAIDSKATPTESKAGAMAQKSHGNTSRALAQNCTTLQGQIFDCRRPPEGKAIPKIIHFMYKRQIKKDSDWPNLVWKYAFNGWKQHYPDKEYKYMFWDDDAVLKQFQRHCPDYSSLYKSFANNISRSDLSRYCILHEFGGIYADLDYEPRANFYSSLLPGKISLLESPYSHEILQNSLMASPPGETFWADMLAGAHGKYRRDLPDPTSATGPHIVDAIAFGFPQVTGSSLKFPALQEYKLRDDVNMLPCGKFQRRTHRFAPEEERLLDQEKPGCSMLDLNNFKQMKGIHWGTWSWRTGQMGGKVDCAEIQKFWGVLHGTLAKMNGPAGLVGVGATYD